MKVIMEAEVCAACAQRKRWVEVAGHMDLIGPDGLTFSVDLCIECLATAARIVDPRALPRAKSQPARLRPVVQAIESPAPEATAEPPAAVLTERAPIVVPTKVAEPERKAPTKVEKPGAAPKVVGKRGQPLKPHYDRTRMPETAGYQRALEMGYTVTWDSKQSRWAISPSAADVRAWILSPEGQEWITTHGKDPNVTTNPKGPVEEARDYYAEAHKIGVFAEKATA